MNVSEIGDVFRAVYNGQMNFMTPNFVKYRKAGNLLVEISSGEGFIRGETIYGITVLEIADAARATDEGWERHRIHGGWLAVKRRGDLSCCQGSMEEVNAYIDNRIKGKIDA